MKKFKLLVLLHSLVAIAYLLDMQASIADWFINQCDDITDNGGSELLRKVFSWLVVVFLGIGDGLIWLMDIVEPRCVALRADIAATKWEA